MQASQPSQPTKPARQSGNFGMAIEKERSIQQTACYCSWRNQSPKTLNCQLRQRYTGSPVCVSTTLVSVSATPLLSLSLSVFVFVYLLEPDALGKLSTELAEQANAWSLMLPRSVLSWELLKSLDVSFVATKFRPFSLNAPISFAELRISPD